MVVQVGKVEWMGSRDGLGPVVGVAGWARRVNGRLEGKRRMGWWRMVVKRVSRVVGRFGRRARTVV